MLPAISPFPTVFATFFENFPPFSSDLELSFLKSFSLEESKFHYKGLRHILYFPLQMIGNWKSLVWKEIKKKQFFYSME